MCILSCRVHCAVYTFSDTKTTFLVVPAAWQFKTDNESLSGKREEKVTRTSRANKNKASLEYDDVTIEHIRGTLPVCYPTERYMVLHVRCHLRSMNA